MRTRDVCARTCDILLQGCKGRPLLVLLPRPTSRYIDVVVLTTGTTANDDGHGHELASPQHSLALPRPTVVFSTPPSSYSSNPEPVSLHRRGVPLQSLQDRTRAPRWTTTRPTRRSPSQTLLRDLTPSARNPTGTPPPKTSLNARPSCGPLHRRGAFRVACLRDDGGGSGPRR
jgi:hypothetical protein